MKTWLPSLAAGIFSCSIYKLQPIVVCACFAELCSGLCTLLYSPPQSTSYSPQTTLAAPAPHIYGFTSKLKILIYFRFTPVYNSIVKNERNYIEKSIRSQRQSITIFFFFFFFFEFKQHSKKKKKLLQTF